jgi:hypothetical protein
MPGPDDDESGGFVGPWREIGKHVYASYVIPSSMPTWIPFAVDGLIGLLLGFIVLARYKGPPWAVVVYRTRRFRSFRIPVVHRQEFDTLSAANDFAEHLDAELRRGHLPS